MKGDFLPSSNVIGLRLLLAASSSTIFPVSVEPMNASCKNIIKKITLYVDKNALILLDYYYGKGKLKAENT